MFSDPTSLEFFGFPLKCVSWRGDLLAICQAHDTLTTWNNRLYTLVSYYTILPQIWVNAIWSWWFINIHLVKQTLNTVFVRLSSFHLELPHSFLRKTIWRKNKAPSMFWLSSISLWSLNRPFALWPASGPTGRLSWLSSSLLLMHWVKCRAPSFYSWLCF